VHKISGNSRIKHVNDRLLCKKVGAVLRDSEEPGIVPQAFHEVVQAGKAIPKGSESFAER
jgi:hypothetical protein